jgi:hypothetical protein
MTMSNLEEMKVASTFFMISPCVRFFEGLDCWSSGWTMAHALPWFPIPCLRRMKRAEAKAYRNEGCSQNASLASMLIAISAMRPEISSLFVSE